MNELSNLTEKTITTKELAEVLGVAPRTIQLAVEKLGLTNVLSQVKIRGQNAYIYTEQQATIIKQEIQKHHNLQSRQIDNVSTEMEIMLKIQEGYSLAVQKMNEYKIRAEKAESVVNRIADSTGLKTIQEVADVLGYGSKTFFAMLRGYGILYTTNGVNLPKREYINAGYFEVKEEPYERYGKTFLYSRIYVTSKGLLWLEKKTAKKE